MGAAMHDTAGIRNLALVLALADVDCIDMSPDEAVVRAVHDGFQAAKKIRPQLDLPMVMVSISNGEDVHFRKAHFDANQCPPDCSRPCERVCPAHAITHAGVMDKKCYGCGRCVPICPYSIVQTRTCTAPMHQILRVLESSHVDAVEIHTQLHQVDSMNELWMDIGPTVASELRLVSISFPRGENPDEMAKSLEALSNIVHQQNHDLEVIWQTDGRSMSGDIGNGAAVASVALAEQVTKVLNIYQLPGHVQLAGGTNLYTFKLLERQKMLRFRGAASDRGISGVAFGGFLRKTLYQVLDRLPEGPCTPLESQPDLLREAVEVARTVVSPMREYF